MCLMLPTDKQLWCKTQKSLSLPVEHCKLPINGRMTQWEWRKSMWEERLREDAAESLWAGEAFHYLSSRCFCGPVEHGGWILQYNVRIKETEGCFDRIFPLLDGRFLRLKCRKLALPERTDWKERSTSDIREHRPQNHLCVPTHSTHHTLCWVYAAKWLAFILLMGRIEEALGGRENDTFWESRDYF